MLYPIERLLMYSIYRFSTLATALVSTLASSVVMAIPIQSGWTVTPYVSAGSLPDSPAARVDPNVATSPFSGTVSINIRYGGKSFLCSGMQISARHVATAGHCLDTNGNGSLIDITAAGNDVRVVYNTSSIVGDPGRAIITASAVSMHANYKGFGICPSGVPGFCVNDDIAVITLPVDAPADAKIYRIYGGIVGRGQQTVLAGYGTSGDGINGFTISPDFRVKRSGGNVLDFFEGDDETFTGFDANGFYTSTGPSEVWYADFDGVNSSGVLKDSSCTFYGACTAQLANDIETNIGPGDSGGPSFIDYMGELLLVGNNTFGFSGFGEENLGAFGSLFGGILFDPYEDYLYAATGGAVRIVNVPEPGSLALFAIAFAGAMAGRRRKASAT